MGSFTQVGNSFFSPVWLTEKLFLRYQHYEGSCDSLAVDNQSSNDYLTLFLCKSLLICSSSQDKICIAANYVSETIYTSLANLVILASDRESFYIKLYLTGFRKNCAFSRFSNYNIYNLSVLGTFLNLYKTLTSRALSSLTILTLLFVFYF